jgi:hypothetical protein
MVLYRFLFAPVLLAVAVLHGGGRSHVDGEQRPGAVVQAVRAEVVPAARPVPAAARAPATTHRAESSRVPVSR